MSQPENLPNLVKCNCQNCNGHIAFDASNFKPGETRKVECPHCKWETVLSVPAPGTNLETKSQTSEGETVLIPNAGKTLGRIKSFLTGRFEKFVFTLVRWFAVFWAAVIVLGFFACTTNYILTFFHSKDGGTDQPTQTLFVHAMQNPAWENLGIYLCGLFALFCALTVISFALLLLAIERNTRKKD